MSPVAPANLPPEKKSLMWHWVLLGVVGASVIVGALLLFSLSPGKKAEVEAPRESKANVQSSKPVVANDRCLTEALVKQATTSGSAPDPYSAAGYQTSLTLFFEPDSSSYLADYVADQEEEIKMLGDWASANSDKKFHIEVSSKVQETGLTDAGSALSAERAAKIKQALMARGVPQDKIVVTESTAESGSDEFSKEVRRNVVVTLMGDC